METLLQKAQRLGMKPVGKQPEAPPQKQGGVFDIASDVVKGGLKGAVSTFQGMANVGQKTVGALGGKIAGAITGREVSTELPQIPSKYTEPTSTSQRVGKAAEQIGEWFIPSGIFAKGAKAVEAGIEASKLAKTAVKAGGKIAKTTLGATKLAARSAISGAEGAFVSGIQSGGDTEEMKKTAELTAAFPVVGKGLSVLWEKAAKPALKSAQAVATGVSKDVFSRVRENPIAYDEALKHVEENPETPFFQLSSTIASRLNTLKESAKNAYDKAKNDIKASFADTTFDLNHKIPALSDVLSNFNLAVKQARDRAGKILGEVEVSPTTRTSPYTSRDLAQITDIVRKMRTKNMTIDDLTDFQESVKTFLGDAVKRDDKKMVKLGYSLLDSSIKFVNEVAPQLRRANGLYEKYYKAIASGGGKIVNQTTGELKDGAEQFLSNLQNINKGAQKNILRYVEEATGIPIADNVLVLKDSLKLKNLFPATGSRTQDILRALATGGVGTAVGGLGVGSLAGLGLASPKIQAKLSIAIPKILKKFPSLPVEVKKILQFFSGSKVEGKLTPAEKEISKGVKSALNDMSAGMSIQDVSQGIPKKGSGEIRSTILSKKEPLLQEARKYKSAEEFERRIRKSSRMWHATNADFEKYNPSLGYKGEYGTWFTPFSEDVFSSGLKNLKQAYLKPGVKLAPELLEEEVLDYKELIKRGYRGVVYDESNGAVKLFFPNEDTVTKSQLTDIWKKAHKK